MRDCTYPRLHAAMDAEKTDRRLRPLTRKEAEMLIHRLEEEYEKTKEKLLYQELIVQKTKDELERKSTQIDRLKEQILRNQHSEGDPLEILREELKKAGVKSAKIEDALDDITRLLGSGR
ncbi:hypothetical protein [Candidatus Nitrosotenuis uzonensis]|uniref:hypothetical protein n=1 Tax=Candidatus Nitrosotenuis uzonensis TaxID=1407055 RepID=UPI00064EF1C0|nr:hypothetical protein [Candidatus Nitrosotenuis uzonensis]